jgi:hypothetical protein
MVGAKTIEDYYLVRAECFNRNISLEHIHSIRNSPQVCSDWSAAAGLATYKSCVYAKVVYGFRHFPVDMMKSYGASLLENMSAGNEIAGQYSKKSAEAITAWQNRLLSFAGAFLSFGILLTIVFRVLRSGTLRTLHTPALYLTFLILYHIALSGISFHQGDRLLMINYPFILLLILFLPVLYDRRNKRQISMADLN